MGSTIASIVEKIINNAALPDIEQPLPGRNVIYLAYFLPKELEELSS
jgi:hypothetical protein